jgi:hypothetical protein
MQNFIQVVMSFPYGGFSKVIQHKWPTQHLAAKIGQCHPLFLEFNQWAQFSFSSFAKPWAIDFHFGFD